MQLTELFGRFLKPFVRGHYALQLFPSIFFHLLAGLTCLMLVSDNPVRYVLGNFLLSESDASCQM